MMEKSTTENESKKFPQYLAAITVCLGASATGTVLAWTSNISTELKEGKYNDIPISESDFGWIGSIINLGAMCVCFPIGIICDKIGRKIATLLLTIPFITGWLLIVFANSLAMLLAGRFIIGVAGGAFCIAAPLYTSEIADKKIRGALGSYFQLFLSMGILLAYILGYALSTRVYTIIMAIVPALFCISFVFQPETPIFRMKQGNEKEARRILKRLRGKHYDIDGEIAEIKETLDELKRNNVTLLRSLQKRSSKIATVVSFSLMFFQQAAGTNAVIFYTRDIFLLAKSGLEPAQATMIIGAIQVIATFASTNVIDRLGRRILLLTSSFFMAVGLIMLGIFFTLQHMESIPESTITSISFLPIVGLALFMTVFALGFGPIPWMIASELYPTEIKSIASAAAGTFNWFMSFLITKFYGEIQMKVGGDVTFYIFAGFCILATIFVFIVVPETKGKSLEEIQRELNKESPMKGIDNKSFS